MSTHDDELNRLLDSLAHGETDESFDLDSDSIVTASRFMHAERPIGPSPTFVSHLEDSLMKRAIMQPVAISGRIEHIGEGIGLVAARPLPRRLRIERIAAIAAVAILLLAGSSFFRSGSDNGGTWLMAPVASASPASAGNVKCPDYTQAIVDRLVAAKLPTLPGNGIARYLSANIGENLYFFPASMVPTGPNADTATTAELQALSQMGSDCWGGLSLTNQEPESVALTATIQLEDGRVAAIYDYRLNGVPLEGYVAYVKFDGVWYWYESRLILPDDELAAGTYLNAGTNWKTQMYETTYLDTQQTAVTVREMRVPAGQPVELTVENIGTVDQQFSISDSGNNVDETVAPGESTTVTVTFSPGWNTYATIGKGDTSGPAVGYIYAEDASTSTPVASTSSAANAQNCPNAEELQATEEANGMPTFMGVQVPLIYPVTSPPTGILANTDVSMQPAPNNPNMLIQVTALSDIPENAAPSPEVWDELAARIPTDLYCMISQDEALFTAPISIARMTVLPDNRVGVLLDTDPFGYGTQFYIIYVQGTKQWLPDFMSFALPDPDFAAPANLESQTIVLLQGWNVDSNGEHSSSGWPSLVSIPANTEVTFDVKNLGSEPLTFAIIGTDVSVVLAPEEASNFIVNLGPGVYRYSFSQPTDTASMEPGFIFAVDAPPSATPTS